jgi:hypothetical protein
MRFGRGLTATACLLAALTLLAGCGSADSETAASGGSLASRAAPPKSDFPEAKGRSLAEILEESTPTGLVLSPAATVFHRGENRYSFGVFDKGGAQAGDVAVALYFAQVPKGASNAEALEAPASGPHPALIESLQTEAAFRAKTTSEDQSAAKAVYVTGVDFSGDGEWRVAALIERGGKLEGSLLPSAIVGGSPDVPRVGERAPLIHTPTAADVGGDLAKITTRVPPDTQNQVDYADVLGKEPIVLLFATPQFCVSRVCGPVVDVAEQVKQVAGDRAAFIHMEIYKENDPSLEEQRPQVKAFGLPTEPWLFVIDSRGRIATEIEGAFGVEELTRAVEAVS